MKCSQCESEKDLGNRMPKGWKRIEEQVLCARCVKAGWRTLAVAIPVAGPVNATWEELRQMLSVAWSQSTALANWVMRELYVRDVRRMPGMERLPQQERVYLYPETAQFNLPSRSRTQIISEVEAKYRECRWDVLWSGETSLPSFRYPFPLPTHNQGWSLELGEDGEVVVALRLPGADTRVQLRLRGGKDFVRQRRLLEQIATGEAVPGACYLYRKDGKASDGRNGSTPNRAFSSLVMCKVVVKVRRAAPASSKVFRLATGGEWFLRGEVEGCSDPWMRHADAFRDQCYQYRRWLQRMADDSKYERRKPKRRRKRALQDYAARAKKFDARQNTFIDQVAAEAVLFAKRNGCGVLAYSGHDQSYFPSFRYHQMKESLQNKCVAEGLSFVEVSASGEVASKKPRTARKDNATTKGEVSK